MEIVIRRLNELRTHGLIGDYAIGGAFAFIYYAEPFETQDIDVFAHLPHQGALVTLAPIYAFLKDRGHVVEDEFVIIEGMPLQFLPVSDPLLEEAVREAREVCVGRESSRVFTAEHAVAIALRTGRAKDHMKIEHLLGTARAPLDQQRLADILERHGLTHRWQRFQERYGSP